MRKYKRKTGYPTQRKTNSKESKRLTAQSLNVLEPTLRKRLKVKCRFRKLLGRLLSKRSCLYGKKLGRIVYYLTDKNHLDHKFNQEM